MTSDQYTVHVFWSDEDDAYIAVARELPGCSAWGRTSAEAVSELQDAIDAWIEAAARNPAQKPAGG